MEKPNNIIQLTHYIEQQKKVVPSDFYAVPTSMDDYKILSKRFVAFAIDNFFILSIWVAINIAYSTFIQSFYFFLNIKQQMLLASRDLPINFIVTMTVFWAYFVFCHYTLEGKTIGKMVMRLRTIKDDFIFDPEIMEFGPSLTNSIRRAFGYFICYFSFGTFFSFSFFSEDQRGVPDYYSSTRTVTDEWVGGMLQHKQYQSEIIYISLRSIKQVS